jgi:hypothetical protein
MMPPLDSFNIVLPTTAAGLLVLFIALLLIWIVISVPVYAAGELVTDGKADFGQAMAATLGGGLVYFIVLWGFSFLLGGIFGASTFAIGFAVALIAWLAVYRASFETGWLGAVGLVFLAWVILFVMDVVLTAVFGITFPKFYPF